MSSAILRTVSFTLTWMLLVACTGDTAASLVLAAKKNIEKNEQNTAIIQLKNALQKNSKNAEARFLLGKVLLDSGDVFGASIELQKSLDEGFNSDVVTPVLAEALYFQGLNEKVVSTYGQLTLNTPAANAALRTVVASANLSLGKLREGQDALNSALKIDSNYIPAQLLQVRMFASGNKLPLATELLSKVLASTPQNSDAWVTKGDLAAQRGDLVEAKVDYQEVETFYNSEDVDRQITPDLRVESLQNLMGDEISNALNSLDVDFRTVIILCDLEGFKYDEMAKILDIPIGTVRSRLHRARNLLKEKLSEYAKKMGYNKNS